MNPTLGRVITPEGPLPTARIFDCVLHVIHCPEHDKVAVTCHPNDIFWLPFTPLDQKLTWNVSAFNGAIRVLSGGELATFEALKATPPLEKAYMLDVLRIQLPTQDNTFLTRIVYYARLKPKSELFKCCRESDRIKWQSFTILAESKKYPHSFWGPELFEFIHTIKQVTLPHQKMHSYSLQMARSMPSGGPSNEVEALLASAGVTRNDVDRLLRDFVEHCFPSFAMSLCSFKLYMAKYNFELKENRLIRLFCAFNHLQSGSVSFHELLVGLAAMDPRAEHNATRLAFVFRFYDKSHGGVLSREDFTKMVGDINPNDDERALKVRVKEAAAKFKAYLYGGQVPGVKFTDLQVSAASRQFTNTSGLCRSPKQVFPHIAKMIKRRMWKQRQADAQVNRLDLVVRNKYYPETCQRCTTDRQYRIVPLLADVTTTGLKITTTTAIEGIDEHMKAQVDHKFIAAELLNAIRSFAKDKGTIREPKGVMSNEATRLVQMVRAIRDEILKLFNSRLGKCVEVDSPCYVIGDIHGNLEDLLTLEHRLWRSLPIGPNLLFLGDYVDRGRWGVECALYVLSLKVLYPHKVTLLRGNHEVEDVQRKYSFMAECSKKYGESHGEEILALLSKIFAWMPVTAILDDAIYCAHGGIPHKETTLKAIREMPQEIINERDSELFWEIVWSDPINDEQYRMVCALLKQNPEEQEGYVRNTKRGAAWFFAEQAAENFFKKNNLTHIIRAHEVPQNGFTFHFGDKCATIFSCSHYTEDNKCAVLFVDQERIRVLRIDTSDNGAAFEPTSG